MGRIIVQYGSNRPRGIHNIPCATIAQALDVVACLAEPDWVEILEDGEPIATWTWEDWRGGKVWAVRLKE